MSNRTDSAMITMAIKEEKKKTFCGGCNTELEDDHTGIQCIQAHHFCTDCSIHIVNLFFSDPQHYTPLRCVQCHIDLNPSVFERQLTAEQLVFYHQHMLVLVWAKELLNEDERLDNCPFCSFAVIRSKHDTNFLYCEHPECGKISCLICRKALPKILNDYGNDEEIAEMERHFKCTELADDKHKFDQYLELGPKVPCPSCGLAGMKDDACTHMTCPTCAQLWCYFCGKKVEECNRTQNGTNGILDHNYHWEFNPNRCPMYLTQICDLDDRWPEGDEEQCLVIFHRIRSLRLLREIYGILGEERINELNEHFNILTTCGFTLDEILHEDLTLIKHRDNTSFRRLPRDE
jgi:hypothetical protein